MARSRRILTLTDTQSVLATTGELHIGAYARRARRRRMGLALVGLGLIAGAGAIYWAIRPPREAQELASYKVRVRCTTCGRESVESVATSQSFPLVCPNCRERACKQVWRCKKCGLQFVPERLGGATVCPNPQCRSTQVGSDAAP
jgi:hypothetical protein